MSGLPGPAWYERALAAVAHPADDTLEAWVGAACRELRIDAQE
jgi:hypothetical protein